MSTTARAAYVPFPFAAIVGQEEAKLALVLAAIDPRIGGVLLSGPKGIGKTTLVRAVGDLLPIEERATCAYGCDPRGSSLCADCAATLERSQTLATVQTRAEIVELPANAQLDDVVGAIDLRAALERSAIDFRPGLLARANRTILYVDEINLLADVVVDALLDAAAQGVVRVKRGQHAIDYPSRFSLVGTMNPEEGELRPQITDRIGLRVFVTPESDPESRVEIYRRNAAFARDPRAFAATYAEATAALRAQIDAAIARRPSVVVTPDAERAAVEAVARLGIDSHRTEIVALSAAAALAAWEGREATTVEDVRRIFPLAARLRRSRLKVEALSEHLAEDAAIEAALDATMGESETRDANDGETGGSSTVVSPALAARPPSKRRPRSDIEGQPIGTQPLANGNLDLPATLLDRTVANRAGIAPDPKERVESALPPRLTILIVDASQSTSKTADLVRAAAQELLRPVYAERERAALVSCWGPLAEIVVDENTGRNIDLVATRLLELEPGEGRALTPLPSALEHARRITERFRRAHPGAQIGVAIFSDGRANVPLGGETELAAAIDAGSTRELLELCAEQSLAVATSLTGRVDATLVNLDEYEAHPLMRELADVMRGRYFALNDIVARIPH